MRLLLRPCGEKLTVIKNHRVISELSVISEIQDKVQLHQCCCRTGEIICLSRRPSANIPHRLVWCPTPLTVTDGKSGCWFRNKVSNQEIVRVLHKSFVCLFFSIHLLSVRIQIFHLLNSYSTGIFTHNHL